MTQNICIVVFKGTKLNCSMVEENIWVYKLNSANLGCISQDPLRNSKRWLNLKSLILVKELGVVFRLLCHQIKKLEPDGFPKLKQLCTNSWKCPQNMFDEISCLDNFARELTEPKLTTHNALA